MDNIERYEYLLQKVINDIKVPTAFERLRHLVHKGKTDLREFYRVQVDPTRSWDGVNEIAAYLGITPRTWLKWKKSYPDSRFPEYVEGQLSCDVDRVKDKG